MVEGGRVSSHSVRAATVESAETWLTRVNDQAIRRVLEAAGVEYIDGNGEGSGVRFRGAPAEEKLESVWHVRIAIVSNCL